MNFFIKVIMICGLMAGLAVPTFAAEEKSSGKDKEQKSVSKQEKSDAKTEAKSADGVDKTDCEEGRVLRIVEKGVTGQVSGISNDYIGVTYLTSKNKEYEMGIYIKGTPVLEHVTDLEQIQMGDTVTVEYDVVTEKDDNDQETSRHVAKKIIFVRKAPPPPPETTVLTSEEAEETEESGE